MIVSLVYFFVLLLKVGKIIWKNRIYLYYWIEM